MRLASRSLLVASLAALVGVAVWSGFPLCPMASTFGIPCPGCGLTRATLALLQGDLRAAHHFHPLVLLLLPLFVGFLGAAIWEFVRGAKPRVVEARLSVPEQRFDWSSRRLTLVSSLLLVLVLGVWLARFAGYLGGPVPVTTFSGWLSAFKR